MFTSATSPKPAPAPAVTPSGAAPDLYAITIALQDETTQNKKFQLAMRQTQQRSMVTIAQAEFDTANKAADARFNAGVASSVTQIAGGVLQVGGGAASLKVSVGAASKQLKAASKTEEADNFKLLSQAHREKAAVETDKIKDLRAELKDTKAPERRAALRKEISHARSEQRAQTNAADKIDSEKVAPRTLEADNLKSRSQVGLTQAQAASELTRGIGTMVEGSGKVAASFDTLQADQLEAQGKLLAAYQNMASNAEQNAHESINNLRDAFSESNATLKAINQSNQESSNLIARNYG